MYVSNPSAAWRGSHVNKRCCCREPAQTLRLYHMAIASHLGRAPNSRYGGHEFESPVQREHGALTKVEWSLGVRSFYSGDLDVITWSSQSCLAAEHSQLGTSLAGFCLMPRQCWYFTGRITCPMPLLYISSAVPMSYCRELCRDTCWDIPTSIRLASHLVRVHKSMQIQMTKVQITCVGRTQCTD